MVDGIESCFSFAHRDWNVVPRHVEGRGSCEEDNSVDDRHEENYDQCYVMLEK